jgi:hypothetical protein
MRTQGRASSSRTLQVAPGMHDIDVLTPNGTSHKRRVSIAAGDTVKVDVGGR